MKISTTQHKLQSTMFPSLQIVVLMLLGYYSLTCLVHYLKTNKATTVDRNCPDKHSCVISRCKVLLPVSSAERLQTSSHTS